MQYANAYEKLYQNMKTKFTVVKNNNEYTLGEYMSLKSESAIVKRDEKSKAEQNAVSFFNYLKGKITAKRENRERSAFPLRTLASSCLSAMVVCALLLSFGAFTSKNDAPVSEIIDSLDTESETLNYEFSK